ncbi:phage major capsid protein [Pseudescherichia sp. L3]|uniref:phage major capsid protein n=1 Tax=Pseudescherichia sp. L3 TaxID=2970817 RepID=UPI00214FFB8F|nr:phage major capsid protein [Pseudescherichia sp. L3]MCR4457039.1 phage major capsid protein [Pseudescherichia sp. L3]
MEIKNNNKRELTIPLQAIDIESRTVEIAFCSELPAKRKINDKDYNEILLCSTENVDLRRLNQNAALLWNHDPNAIIGSVLSARMDADRVGRATVRISNTAENIWQMILEGTLTHISVGYFINDFRIDGDNIIVTSFTPYEISWVTIPVDPTVGIGRSLDPNENLIELETLNSPSETIQEGELMEENTQDINEPENEHVEAEVVREEVQEEALETEQEEAEVVLEEQTRALHSDDELLAIIASRPDLLNKLNSTEEPLISNELINTENERQLELTSIGKVLNIDVSDAIAKGISVTDFKRQINENKNIKDDKMKKDFTLKNGLRSFANEEDMSAFEQGKRGLVVPTSALRAVNTTVGANLIQETIDYDSYIDILRANSVLANFPITVISGLEGDGKLSLPALNSDFTDAFGFIEEDGKSPEATPAYGKVTLEPKDFTGSVYLTRIMMKSSNAAERYTTDAMIKGASSSLEKDVMAKVVSEAVKEGNVKEVAALSNIDFDAVVDAMGELGSNNVVSSKVVAVMSPKTRAALRKQVIKGNTSAKFLVEGQGSSQLLAGEIPVIESTLVADDQVILGDFSQIVIAQWGSDVELDKDETTSRDRGGLYLRIWATINYALARPEAFYVLRVGA